MFLRDYFLCSEVEKELGLLFCKGGKKQNKSKQPGTSTKFQMLVEDVREGVLVKSLYLSFLCPVSFEA